MKQIAENRVKVAAAGGIEVIVKTINRHIWRSDVRRHGCNALYNMIANNGKTIDKINNR